MRGNRIFQTILYGDLSQHTLPKPERKGRSEELVRKRNELFVNRIAWYQIYHKHLCYEEVLRRLEQELHLAQFTLSKMVAQYAGDILAVKKQNPNREYFRKKWEYMVW